MPLKRPNYAYRHPSKETSSPETPETIGEPASRSDAKAPQQDKLERQSRPSGPHRPDLAGRVGTRPMEIAFAVPRHGGLVRFREMTENGIAPRTAILAIGTHALRAYQRAMNELDHGALLERFGASELEVDTRRVVEASVRDRAWSILDPFGVRSDREIGRLLGRVAVQHWIEAEQKLVS